jgi:hypothetical protein
VAKTLLAAGALAVLVGGLTALAHAPQLIAPVAPTLAGLGAVAVLAGLLFLGASALEQRLIDTELTLIETREQLKAAVAALEAPQARRAPEPAFRSRPAARRRQA